MKNFKCPKCRQPTIGFWRRQIIGPTAPAECSNCGAMVGVTWSSFWTLIPFIIVWGISELIAPPAFYWGLNIAGLAVTMWMTNQFVPLVVRS